MGSGGSVPVSLHEVSETISCSSEIVMSRSTVTAISWLLEMDPPSFVMTLSCSSRIVISRSSMPGISRFLEMISVSFVMTMSSCSWMMVLIVSSPVTMWLASVDSEADSRIFFDAARHKSPAILSPFVVVSKGLGVKI